MLISPLELKRLLDDEPGRLCLIDVRNADEWSEYRIPHAIWRPLVEIPFCENELDRSVETVVYCARGNRSLQAMIQLRMMGFQRVKSLSGGVQEWIRMFGKL